MQLLGAAQPLKAIQQDAPAGHFNPLQRLLDPSLSDGGQKPRLRRRRF